jgi:hypothetical protein
MPRIRARDLQGLIMVRDGLRHAVEVLKGRGELDVVERLERMLDTISKVLEYAERSYSREKARNRVRAERRRRGALL